MVITDEMLREAAASLDNAMLAALPDANECTHVFSPGFERKMKKLINRVNYFGAYRVFQRVACFFIALVLSATMLLAFNPNVRAAVVDWFKEKIEDFYHFVFVGEQVEATPKEYSLGWVPDGYVLLDTLEKDTGNTVLYLDMVSGNIMQFDCMYGADYDSIYAGSGDYSQTAIDIGAVNGELYLAKDSNESNILVWRTQDGQVMFTITAFLGEEDLIKMAQNLVATEIE